MEKYTSVHTLINTLRLRQNGRHFPDDIFKLILLNENAWISIKISLKFVPSGPISNIPALVQIMARRRPGDKPLSEPMIFNFLTHICATLPQSVLTHSRSHATIWGWKWQSQWRWTCVIYDLQMPWAWPSYDEQLMPLWWRTSRFQFVLFTKWGNVQMISHFVWNIPLDQTKMSLVKNSVQACKQPKKRLTFPPVLGRRHVVTIVNVVAMVSLRTVVVTISCSASWPHQLLVCICLSERASFNYLECSYNTLYV